MKINVYAALLDDFHINTYLEDNLIKQRGILVISHCKVEKLNTINNHLKIFAKVLFAVFNIQYTYMLIFIDSIC